MFKNKECYNSYKFSYDTERGEGQITTLDHNTGGCYLDGEWRFTNTSKNKINLIFTGNSPLLGPWGGTNNSKWDVIQLKDEEMIFEIYSNNSTYRVELSEI